MRQRFLDNHPEWDQEREVELHQNEGGYGSGRTIAALRCEAVRDDYDEQHEDAVLPVGDTEGGRQVERAEDQGVRTERSDGPGPASDEYCYVEDYPEPHGGVE